MKCLLVVCDGMADRPIKSLGGKTPLEFAKTPNLDEIANKGISGIVDIIAPGIRPGSDTAHLAILGYDPRTSYTGRGPFEAAGVGMKANPGDVAFRSNFATTDENGVIIDRRAGRIEAGTKDLAKAINEIKIPGLNFRFKESTGHRGAFVLSGEELSHKITESDPHHEGVKPREINPLDDSASAQRTAAAINDFIVESAKVLSSHPVNIKRLQEKKNPANILLLRGAGIAPSFPPFQSKHGLSGGCIASVALVRGVARFCGLEVIGADPSTAVDELARKALAATKQYDFILLNIKGADDASHDGDLKKKINVIEEIDKAITVFSDFSAENYLALLSDHTSSITRKDHCGDPVPMLIAGPEVRRDDVSAFSEGRAAADGGLCRIRGGDIMNILVDLMNRSEKFGA
jgi:2,3-bisphosphoglycerate-independent phosphoglycerate mutase